MAILFIEPILDQVKTLLLRDLNDKINEINAEKNDAYVLSEVLSTSYTVGQKRLIRTHPWIEIYPEDSPGEDFTTCSIRNQHSVAIRITNMRGSNEEDSSRKTYRYLRAVTEVLQATPDLERAVDLFSYDGHSYQDYDQANGGAYLYQGTAFFICDQEEAVRSTPGSGAPVYIATEADDLLITESGDTIIRE